MSPAPSHAPPPALVDALVRGPSLLRQIEWHEQATSTNALAAEAAARGAPEGFAVLADRQTAGRGRQGRHWLDVGGSSLLLSLVLRPDVPAERLTLLPLLAGLALAEAVGPFCAGAEVALKWPNDLLIDSGKAAGILAEGPLSGAVVLGIGLNVDWRGVERRGEVADAVSLAEAARGDVDRWKVFAGLIGVFGRHYGRWQRQPVEFLDDYRARCATLGRLVRVTRVGEADPLEGVATAIAEDGALIVATADGPVAVSAGDVEHLRPS